MYNWPTRDSRVVPCQYALRLCDTLNNDLQDDPLVNSVHYSPQYWLIQKVYIPELGNSGWMLCDQLCRSVVAAWWGMRIIFPFTNHFYLRFASILWQFG